MAIQLGPKGAYINGTQYPAFAYVLGLPPDQEKYLAQGGDALDLVVGGILFADIPVTTGAPGERRTLTDGPDAGIELVWAVPDGSSAYAWCWAIYPLASYL